MLKHVRLAIVLGCAVVPALFVLTGGSANAQLRASSQEAQSSTPQTGQPSQGNMAEMMKQHQQMMADMKAADAKLDALVSAMNAATGEAKVSAVAQVVNELVRQQKALHEHMGT